MSNVCILTDSTAQFTQPDFTGHERVHIIPFELRNSEWPGDDGAMNGIPAQKRLVPPSAQDFMQYYASLSRSYDSILVLTLSAALSSVMQNAVTGSEQSKTCAPVEVIDSQSTCIGLGMLVQMAAEAAMSGASIKEIDLCLRANIQRVYMLFCLPELTSLAQTGQMDYAQALVAEMMGILPIFTFEEGRLRPIEKVRTPRHLYEAFEEFMSEFEDPAQIALMHSTVRGGLGTTQLSQFVQETFPNTRFSEHALQPPMEALFGARSLGLVLLDSI